MSWPSKACGPVSRIVVVGVSHAKSQCATALSPDRISGASILPLKCRSAAPSRRPAAIVTGWSASNGQGLICCAECVSSAQMSCWQHVSSDWPVAGSCISSSVCHLRAAKGARVDKHSVPKRATGMPVSSRASSTPPAEKTTCAPDPGCVGQIVTLSVKAPSTTGPLGTIAYEPGLKACRRDGYSGAKLPSTDFSTIPRPIGLGSAEIERISFTENGSGPSDDTLKATLLPGRADKRSEYTRSGIFGYCCVMSRT